MEERTKPASAPVIVGLAAGIAFILVLGILPSLYTYATYRPSPDPDYYSPLIQLRINGLKETYKTGERIDFAVSQKAAGCVFPDTVLVKDANTGQVVWQFDSARANTLLFGCISMADDPSRSRMTMNTRDEPPIIINQAGSYVVEAKHLHVELEQHFAVVE